MSVIATIRYELRIQRRLMRRHPVLNRCIVASAVAAMLPDTIALVRMVLA